MTRLSSRLGGRQVGRGELGQDRVSENEPAPKCSKFVDWPKHGHGRSVGTDSAIKIPLWDCNDAVLAVWNRLDGPEFIKFDIEAWDEYTPLARTEQGFWATQFDAYYESEAPVEELREAATAVGFQFLDRQLTARDAAESRLGTFDGHRTWLKELVTTIDRESSDPRRV